MPAASMLATCPIGVDVRADGLQRRRPPRHGPDGGSLVVADAPAHQIGEEQFKAVPRQRRCASTSAFRVGSSICSASRRQNTA